MQLVIMYLPQLQEHCVHLLVQSCHARTNPNYYTSLRGWQIVHPADVQQQLPVLDKPQNYVLQSSRKNAVVDRLVFI